MNFVLKNLMTSIKNYPVFGKYPIQEQNLLDFQDFSKVANLINKKSSSYK